MKRYLIIIVIAALLIALYFLFFNNDVKRAPIPVKNDKEVEVYKHDGSVFFIDKDGDTISKLYVEIADDYYSQARGLMYRSSMPDTVGMLFIYEDYDFRSFWMKNTHISLDLIFIDKDLTINKVHEYAIPYSEESIVSTDKAKYVIEVNAGYTDQHKIDPGQPIILNR